MRQGKIEQLINQQVISNQEELMQALQAIGISADASYDLTRHP